MMYLDKCKKKKRDKLGRDKEGKEENRNINMERVKAEMEVKKV